MTNLIPEGLFFFKMNEGKGMDILMDFLNSDILNFNDKTHDVKKGQYLLVTQNIPQML